jgi:glycosyltransferase involved in cell wall biosynthesis
MKVVFCWSGMSGYMAACWRALARVQEVDTSLFVLWWSMPWAKSVTDGLPDFHRINQKESMDGAFIEDSVAQLKPDVVVLCGWSAPAFSRLPFCERLRDVKFVMGMDTPWRGGWRQKLARLRIGRLVDRMDAVFVASERAWQYARHLGVPEAKIHRGVYGVDCLTFRPVYDQRLALEGGWPRRFLFVGRYDDEKGIDVLLESYKRYCSMVSDPWPLACCGSGPWAERIAQAEGVRDLGFVQPGDLGAVFAKHGVFVLASRYEPWGVVIAEATAAGLPVICTESCGASIDLVRSLYNGMTVATGDAHGLARAMLWMHENHARLPEMGLRSQQRASAYSAEAWAERWAYVFHELCP